MTARRTAPVAALGLTWREAPTAVREIASAPLSAEDVAGLRAQGLHGLVEVHTCARSLWLLAADDPSWVGALLQARLSARLIQAGCTASPELRVGDLAVRYLLRVSIGLDSFVEGEADVGGQVLDGFQAAAAAAGVSADLQSAWRAVVDLGAEARREGLVRPGRGMGHLAVDTLLREHVPLDSIVGVVGHGRIAKQVCASLGRAGFPSPQVYNRTPSEGVLPLTAIASASHEGWVICSAAGEPWFVSPPGARVVVDLGRPGQVVGTAIDLDALLGGFGLRMRDDARERADGLVDLAVEHWRTRQRIHASHRVLARVQALRDEFVHDRVPELMAEALDGMDAPTRKRMIAAAQQAVRRYSHEVLGALKETVG